MATMSIAVFHIAILFTALAILPSALADVKAAQGAVSAALRAAQGAQAKLKTLPKGDAAVETCLENVSTAADSLRDTLAALAKPLPNKSDVQTWASAALTDQDTCMEESKGSPSQAPIQSAVAPLGKLISKALAVINTL